MQSLTAHEASTAIATLQRQHEAYFPIVNEPELLAEYVLGFFGPDGSERLLTESDCVEARNLLALRCSSWQAHCKGVGKIPVFVEARADYDSICKEDLALRVGCILQILEDADHLLSYVEKAFGPNGPKGLAITDEATWNRLDDLFLCRLP